MIPIEAKESLDRYVKNRISTGGFLRACLANDFMEAVGRADVVNIHYLRDIASYIYNDMPISSHGSYEIVDNWLKEN